MDRFKKILIVACLAVAAVSAVNVDNAEAGGFCHTGLIANPIVTPYVAPVVAPPVVHVAPVVHCQYKIFVYDCGIWRCVHTCNDLLVAQHKVLLLQRLGYLTTIRKIIL